MSEQFIRRALDSRRGDNLERAKRAFGNMTDKQLDEQYGQSGQTCREVLAGYQKDRDRHNTAVECFDSLITACNEHAKLKEEVERLRKALDLVILQPHEVVQGKTLPNSTYNQARRLRDWTANHSKGKALTPDEQKARS